MTDGDEPAFAQPTPAALAALDSDAWAQVLAVLRAVLGARTDLDEELARVRDTPTGRLAGGRGRRALCERLAQDATLWSAVALRLEGSDVLAELRSGSVVQPAEASGGGASGRSRRSGRAGGSGAARSSSTTDDALGRTRERARRAREDRDAWRRRAEGAEARVERFAAAAEAAEARVEELEGQLEQVRAQLADAAAERERAVTRERRRRDAEVARLEAELSAWRRADEERRQASRRAREAAAQVQREAAEQSDAHRRQGDDERGTRVIPGRPSRLPAGVAPGTTEAARALLHRGRLVLVDGYNVTKQHRGQLDLEGQRTWLVQLLATAAAARGIRPVVVFDGQRSGGGRPPSGVREVRVRFTDEGITADDELVLAVEGTDEPVVVVTDDRELAARVALGGADVVDTVSFLGAMRSGGT